MPTKKPRVTFTISEDELQRLENYQYENRIKNQTQAILSLISKGLNSIAPVTPDHPVISEQDGFLLSLFHQLNDEGQEKVKDYTDDLVQSGKYIKNNPAKLGKEA